MCLRVGIAMETIETKAICPLCGAPIEIKIKEKGFYGHAIEGEKLPDGAIVYNRRPYNGKTRCDYRFLGYVPHCSNKYCFLYSANKTFRSKDVAMEAWNEKVTKAVK